MDNHSRLTVGDIHPIALHGIVNSGYDSGSSSDDDDELAALRSSPIASASPRREVSGAPAPTPARREVDADIFAPSSAPLNFVMRGPRAQRKLKWIDSVDGPGLPLETVEWVEQNPHPIRDAEYWWLDTSDLYLTVQMAPSPPALTGGAAASPHPSTLPRESREPPARELITTTGARPNTYLLLRRDIPTAMTISPRLGSAPPVAQRFRALAYRPGIHGINCDDLDSVGANFIRVPPDTQPLFVPLQPQTPPPPVPNAMRYTGR
jgi:hypothetical protein